MDDEIESKVLLFQKAMIPHVKDRKYNLVKYRQCFVASKAVEVIKDLFKCSAVEAVAMGNVFFQLKIFCHVLHEHEFENSFLFFRFLDWENIIDESDPLICEILATRLMKIIQSNDRMYFDEISINRCYGYELVNFIMSNTTIFVREETKDYATFLIAKGLLFLVDASLTFNERMKYHIRTCDIFKNHLIFSDDAHISYTYTNNKLNSLIVFVPGIGEAYAGYVPALDSCNIMSDYYTFDLRGNGNSSGIVTETETIDQIFHDFSATLTEHQIEQEWNNKQIFFVVKNFAGILFLLWILSEPSYSFTISGIIFNLRVTGEKPNDKYRKKYMKMTRLALLKISESILQLFCPILILYSPDEDIFTINEIISIYDNLRCPYKRILSQKETLDKPEEIYFYFRWIRQNMNF